MRAAKDEGRMDGRGMVDGRDGFCGLIFWRGERKRRRRRRGERERERERERRNQGSQFSQCPEVGENFFSLFSLREMVSGKIK